MRSEPAPSRPRVGHAIAAALVLGAIAGGCMLWRDTPVTRTAATPTVGATGVGTAAACALEPRCAAGQALAAAGPACSQAIAQLAAYGMRWTTGDEFCRYPRRDWRVDLPGTIRYGGDTAEFEDGAGRYRRVRYECDFDPGPHAVLDVRIWPR